MKKKLIFMVTIANLLVLAGCGVSEINRSKSLTRPEIAVEEVTEEIIEVTKIPETNCSVLNPHPVAQGMEEDFDITYDEVMTLYCDGYAFSDILLALETSELVDQTPEALLARLRTRTWQEIWTEFGLNPE